ncbi:alpha,alpha-trehalase [Nematocida minor]|uniref:alpha,alpha-trehalase n=1 Tax=Nematocida minor TaxID=1912983 RepID=UPI002220E5EC|nr:alpha,alpha-trehalase [Nematocida minor]KAI5191314.1 alpha,alpha-trehalase [Nematocida minor]
MTQLTPTKGRRRTVQTEPIKESKIRRKSTQTNLNREFVCNIQSTIQRLLDQEDTTKDSTITVDDLGPKRYLIEMNQGNETWLEGNYSISTLLQELALADINLKTVIVPETILNEHSINRLTRLIKTCFWQNLRRVLDLNGLKLALIDTKISRVEFFLYVPSFDIPSIHYYKNTISALAESGFTVKMVKIRTSKDAPSGVYFADSLSTREVLSDTAPGLLSLSFTYFFSSPTIPENMKNDCINSTNGRYDSYKKDIPFASSWHNPVVPPSERGGYIQRGVGPCPFYVPGGRFNEMYGWDSYFIAKGLIMSGQLAEAFCIAENLRYQIEAYGKILNANRTYYLFRGNPPLFSTLVLELFLHLAPNEKSSLEDWFASATDAMIKEYYYFHRGYDEELGLTRHTPGGKGIPMETEEGHFFSAIRKTVPGSANWSVEQLNEYIKRYNKGEEVSEELEEYLQNDRAVRESGHDTSKRVDGIASYLYTVDLNSLLYKTEQDILKMRSVPEIAEISKKRKVAINTVLWNGECYFDYNGKTKKLSTYKGATVLYPLYAEAADREKAAMLVDGLGDLIGRGGIFTGTKESCTLDLEKGEMQRQWDYPYGWAPHQIIGWTGLVNYGYDGLAKSLALKWCTMIGRIFAQYNGVVTEKYNLEKSTHKVNVEYGNIGTDIRYVPREGFGWTNASWLLGLSLLGEKGRRELYARIVLE